MHFAQAQLNAFGKDWGARTQYVGNFEEQDSIYTFFAPKVAKLTAKHTTNDTANFVWMRYNASAKDFLPISTIFNQTSSELVVPAEGGYRVKVTSKTDSVQIFTAWVFIDDVAITGIESINECDYLSLNPKTQPNIWDVEYERFAYWDISKPMHTVNNTYGKLYFKNIKWQSSNAENTIPPAAPLKLIIESPAPLYDATYTLTVNNPFGRVLSMESAAIAAVAVKAAQKIKIFNKDIWSDFSQSENYEALLETSVASEAVNADSIFWVISKKSYIDNKMVYDPIWRYATIFSTNEQFPDKRLMLPGGYRLQHRVKKSTSGCVDSVYTDIKVDSSVIKKEAIPNVFSPTVKDGSNDVFVFIEPYVNIRSMKTCIIRIYTRTGEMVHRYDGDPRSWAGWDGSVRGSGIMASQGVYFFIIECVGWDGKTFKRGPLKGTLHLY